MKLASGWQSQPTDEAWTVVIPGAKPTFNISQSTHQVWQNRLNYSGSSALVIAIQPILTQLTSNGITHWSAWSPPDTTTVQQDRSRFTSHEGEFTITAQLINFNLQKRKYYYKPFSNLM
jgi:hypothetical protein